MHARLALSLALASLVVTSAACGAVDGLADPSAATGLDQDGSPPVQLFHARATTRVEYAASQAEGYLRGYIRVANLAYEKQVVVHYQGSSQGSWSDSSAWYRGALGDGAEVWEFELGPVSYSSRLSADFRFAIRYEVAGQTFWDNNGGQDYRVSTGPRPLYQSDLILGRSAIALTRAQGYNGFDGNTVHGEITVKNLAYHKDIALVYGVDGWDQVRVAQAYYMRPLSDDSELWSFDLPLGGGYGQVMNLEFALRYRVDGREIWDNNFGINYTLQVPGTID